jgi:ribosomal-protein-alanine N-acetyltransferase
MSRSLPYTIRSMATADVPTVAAIERISFPTPWQPSSFLYELNHNPRSFYYVLLKPEMPPSAPPRRGWRRWLHGAAGFQNESRVIGYVGFRLRSTEAHISTIAIHPEWRGRGLGELLLLTALEQGLELGVSTVTLEVRPSNHVAQRLYRKYGFRLQGVRRGYYRDGEDAWLMKVEVSRDFYPPRLAELRQALEERLRRPPVGVGQNSRDTL